jgi:hypothetical protein
MKRKFVSRALPSALVAGSLLIAGAMSASAADENATPSTEQSTGGLGDALTDTVDAVVGDGGAVDSTLNQVTDTVEQVTKKDGAVDDTVKGVTSTVNAVAGKDGAIDDVVTGATGGSATTSANEGGPVEDVLGGVSGTVNALAGQNGAVDDVLGADGPERGLTDNLPAEIISDVGSVGENVGNADVPGTIGAVAGEDGVVDDLLESPAYASAPGGSIPGDGGSGDVGTIPGAGDGVGDGLVPVVPGAEAQAPGALAETGGQMGGAVAAGIALTAAGAAMIRARRRMLEVQG